jgi:hypothetical protein
VYYFKGACTLFMAALTPHSSLVVVTHNAFFACSFILQP